jgi:hypothetical protein
VEWKKEIIFSVFPTIILISSTTLIMNPAIHPTTAITPPTLTQVLETSLSEDRSQNRNIIIPIIVITNIGILRPVSVILSNPFLSLKMRGLKEKKGEVRTFNLALSYISFSF